MITPHVQCCCPDCVAIRRAFVARTHPLLRAKAEDPGPSLIPADQALAMRLEDEDELEEMLANTRAEIKILREAASGVLRDSQKARRRGPGQAR